MPPQDAVVVVVAAVVAVDSNNLSLVDPRKSSLFSSLL